jgi:hypothetical protein
LEPGSQPRLQLLPRPVIHADLAPAAALATRHQHGAAPRGTPEHDDEAAQALAMAGLAGGPHDRDDSLDGGRVRRVAHSLDA